MASLYMGTLLRRATAVISPISKQAISQRRLHTRRSTSRSAERKKRFTVL